MVDLTVVILTKNEEKNLRKCVESFRGCVKRFVIVDSFSTDHTESLSMQLAEELKEIGSSLDFYQNPFINYATQFNWGLTQSGIFTEWTMRMDADEEMTENLVQEIEEKLSTVPLSINGIVIRRRVYFMGRWIRHGGRYPELLLRIFRTGKAICEIKIMDEHMVLSEGISTTFQNDLIDNNQKDLDWWISKHNWYSNREVMDHELLIQKRYTEGKQQKINSSRQAKWKRLVKNRGYYNLPKFTRAFLYYFYRYYIRLGFLDGPEGKMFHFLQAYWYRFLVDAKMFEHEKNGTKINQQGDLKEWDEKGAEREDERNHL